MQYAEIKNGMVANIVLYDDEPYATSMGYIRSPQNVAIGWTYDGVNFVAPVPPPAPIVPAVIADLTPRQIRMALTRAGLRVQVEAAIALGDQDLKDWWEFSQTFERSHQEVQVMASALGQTAEQVDALWALGATL